MNSDKIHELIVVGAGPSALAAAIYTTREDIETTLYEKAVVGGMAAITDKVDNYPGFPDGVEGMTLAGELEKQAVRFGAVIDFGEASELRDEGDYKVVVIDGQDVKSKAVLIATGSDYKKIGVPGEAEFYARGVHYCATCDGAFYRDKKLAVVGGGNSAVQETLFLTRYASHIDLLVRSDVKASEVLQKDLQEYIDSGKVTLHTQTATKEITSTDGSVDGVLINEDGEDRKIDVDGVFVFVGLKPNTGFLHGSGVELDEVGLVKTNEHLETTVSGVFASGDVRSGATMQIASAVGEGATAAISVREYLESKARG